MDDRIPERILLTGAGFTKNFGGFLAEEMWEHIFNHPNLAKYPSIKQYMMRDFDYESVYYNVSNEIWPNPEERNAVINATFDAYRKLDNVVLKWIFDGHNVNKYKVDQLINLFYEKDVKTGYIFTLNQDLFIERHYDDRTNAPIGTPGLDGKLIPDTKQVMKQPLDEEDFKTLPKTIEFKRNNGLRYIKLHGSYGWKSSDGTNRLVIGYDKRNQINKEPLLSLYFNLFKKVLSHPNRKLLVIGYGFGDEHINEVIINSIMEYELKLYIIEPRKPSDFFKEVINAKGEASTTLKHAIQCYYSKSLLDIFPGNQEITETWKEIKAQFFGQ